VSTAARARPAVGRKTVRDADAIATLIGRFDGEVLDPHKRATRVRLVVLGGKHWDAVIEDGNVSLEPARGKPDAVLSASAATWGGVAEDLRGAMNAYMSGRLVMRGNIHDGVSFLAATSNEEDSRPGRLRFATIETRGPRLSIVEAGTGTPVLAMHGLGATKGSFLPTLAALADRERFRVIAVDLPGFGDSDKPIGAAYDAAYFAETMIGLLDRLEIDRTHLLGNSLGGRVALELGLSQPDRVLRIGLLAPSLAWLRGRPLQPLVRLARPELGLLQFTPRPLIERAVRRLIPGAQDGWAAVGVDEFLRSYLTRSGRAAFYAAARHIYLEEPGGESGFWTRLATLQPDALFIWGRRDRLVPHAFARHVATTLPRARHLELDCGHVPQIERPHQTHAALSDFFTPPPRGRIQRRARSTRSSGRASGRSSARSGKRAAATAAGTRTP
jgi:pimeloyl-ACP methyl ester carboxylesterase